MLGPDVDRLRCGTNSFQFVAEAPLSMHYLNSPGLSNANQRIVLSAWAKSLGMDSKRLYRANEDEALSHRFEIAAEEELEEWETHTVTFIQLFNISIL